MASVVCKSPWTAHPRSRGEHTVYFVSSPYKLGSSPLARGTLCAWFYSIKSSRLIPARAGNTLRHQYVLRGIPAHPRSRGEHRAAGALRFLVFGSSPLARGTQMALALNDTNYRLIPARAGNTWFGVRQAACRAAHPRSRGEHLEMTSCSTGRLGSSPLARGTLLRRL